MTKNKSQLKTLLAIGLAAVTLGLTGCEMGGEYRAQEDLYNRIEWKDIAPEEAKTMLAPKVSPSILAVRSYISKEDVETEEIILENSTTYPGENYLRTRISYAQNNRYFLATGTKLFNEFNDVSVNETLAKEFPMFTPRITNAREQNRYGSYYYALAGERGSDSGCVYAWQVIREHSQILPNYIHAIIREYRYCGKARDPQKLLAYFNHSWLRYDLGILPSIEEASLYRSDRNLTLSDIGSTYTYPDASYANRPIGQELPPVEGQIITPPESRADAIRPGQIRQAPTLTNRAYDASLQQGFDQIRTDFSAGSNQGAGTSQMVTIDPNGTLLSLYDIGHVRLIQARLKQIGLYRGEIDGIWGRLSKEGLVSFRLSRGLRAPHRWDLETQRLLFSGL